MESFLQCEPRIFVSPILHIQMGLINLAIEELSQFIDTYVECVTENEKEIQVRAKNTEATLNELKDSNQNSDQQKKDLTSERREITQLVKSTRREKIETEDVIAAWEDRQEDCVAEYKSVVALMKQQQLDISKTWKEVKIDKEVLERMEKARLKDASGFEVEVDKILGEEAKIYKEAYHGGTLNSV